MLTVLNQIWQCGLPAEQLAEIGLNLGADVPFFLFGESALVRGIGEQIQPIDVPEQWFVVVRPDCHVATAAVFAHPDLPRNSPSHPVADYLARQPFHNDMQDVVCQRYPQVGEALRLLSAHGEARMTGSGACVFVAVANRAAGEAVCAALPNGLMARCVKSLPQHPLREII